MFQLQPAALQCSRCNINRQFVFFGKNRDAVDMVAMFVRYEYRFYLLHREAKPLHPPFRLAAGYTCINQHSLVFIADIIAIAVAARI